MKGKSKKYLCELCGIYHRSNSNIGREHLGFEISNKEIECSECGTFILDSQQKICEKCGIVL